MKMQFRFKLINFSVLIIFLLFSAGSSIAQNTERSGKAKIQPPRNLSKIDFVSGSRSLNIPFDLSSNLVLLQASVNNSEPLWFILDTGAGSTVIDLQLAKSLGLKSSGKDFGNGAAGSAEAAVYKGVSLRLPNIEAVNQTIYGLPIDFFAATFGRKISGIIGLDIIKNFVVEIDYAARIMNFYAPEDYSYSGNGEIVPLTVGYESLLFTRASIETMTGNQINGKFELDTGSTGAILLNSPFVNKNRLLKSVAKTKQVKTGGIGGTGRSFLGRVKNLKIGKFALANPIAHFYQDTKGDNASAKYDGLIGGGIFRRFKVIFDISRQQMILEPNGQIFRPFEIDISGLVLIADGDDLSTVLVDDVEANSPAAAAGIKGGDIITAIDNRPAKDFTLNQIREMFKQKEKEYLLTIKRGNRQLQFKIRLQGTFSL